jgi:hypothetical protein
MTIADTIKGFSAPLYRLRIFVIIIAVLAAPFAVYYLIYVRSQNGYFTDRSFRKLSLISSQIALKVESAGSVLKNTSDKFIRPQVRESGSPTFEPDQTRRQENLDRLKEVFKRLKDDSPQIVPVNIDTEPWSDKVSPGTVTLSAVRHEGDSSWLYLDYVSEGIEEKTVVRVQAKADLSRLIQPFLSARVGSDPDQFQNLLIAETDSGRVIFQNDKTQVRLASLDKLPSSSDPAKKIELKEIAQTSSVIDVSLAGSSYRLFSHPLKLSLPSSNASAPEATWITSGLVKSNYFQTEAWSISIPYTILIFCGFLVALLVFSWPFLKLVLAGPKDRFKPTDVYFLIFATIVVLAVLTCFGLYAYVYTGVESRMDAQVARLASDVKKNFNDELIAALKQLETLGQNQELLAQLKSDEDKRKAEAKRPSVSRPVSFFDREPPVKEKLKAAHAGPGTDIYHQKETNKTDILPGLIKSPDTTYHYFDSAMWIDPAGMQRAKWTVKGYTTQYITVSGRAYFDNIRKGHFYELDGYKFWLEPIISRTTGRNEVEISSPVADTPWTLAFDARLLSLMDPVLPGAFGFVIIGNDGRVLFHSDEAHHIGENLFQECDDDASLRSAVIGRSDKPMNVRYLGEDHRFYVTTLDGFPDWSLIVFRNKQPLRSAFFELLTSVTVLFLIYGIILMTGFTVFYLVNVVNERRAWLWPSEKKTAIYVQAFFFLLGLLVISFALTILLHGQKLVWVIAGIAFLSAALYFINLGWGSKSPFLKYTSNFLDRAKRYDRLYVLNVTLLLLLISILPAGAFFKYAYESEITLFIKHAQFSLATALAKRDERIRSRYSNIKFTDDPDSSQSDKVNREQFITKRAGESWDVYDNFFFHTDRQGAAAGHASSLASSQNDFLSNLTTLLPLSNRNSIERRGLLDNASVGGVCKWESGTMGRLVLHLDGKAAQGASPWAHLNTAVPLLGVPNFPGFLVVLLFIPLWLFINFIVRKVFLLDLHKPTSHSLRKLLSEKTDRNLFVVVNAPFVKKLPAKGSNLYLKELPSFASSTDWATTFDNGELREDEVIVLDQFDYRMDDPQINRQKLELVEKLLAKQRTLMILSTVDSSQYRFSNGDTEHVTFDPDDGGRWAGVIIGNFFTEYAEDTDDRRGSGTGDGSSFFEQVLQEKNRILAGGLQGRSMKDVDELFDTLYNECAPREPLQRVGLQILSHQGFITLGRDHLIGRIGNQARTYYVHIWNSCSTGEKLTLGHLAQDRLLSHRDPDIPHLLKRELIVRDQDLHLFNESFRRFVKSADRVSFVAQHDEEARRGSLWQTLKVPILVTMVAITAFLFITQQDVYSSSLALVTGVTTLIPALLKVLSLFQSDPLSRSPNNS